MRKKQGGHLLDFQAQCYKRNYKSNSISTILWYFILPSFIPFLVYCPPVALYICFPSAWTTLLLNRNGVHSCSFFRPVLHTGAFLGHSKTADAPLLMPSPLYIPPLLSCFYMVSIFFWHTIYFTGLSPPTNISVLGGHGVLTVLFPAVTFRAERVSGI